MPEVFNWIKIRGIGWPYSWPPANPTICLPLLSCRPPVIRCTIFHYQKLSQPLHSFLPKIKQLSIQNLLAIIVGIHFSFSCFFLDCNQLAHLAPTNSTPDFDFSEPALVCCSAAILIVFFFWISLYPSPSICACLHSHFIRKSYPYPVMCFAID